MKRKKNPEIERAFKGHWPFTETIKRRSGNKNQKKTGYIEFGKTSSVHFRAVHGQLDVRYSIRDGFPFAEFSLESIDEGETRHGRGWAMLGPLGRIAGHIFIHHGAEFLFTCGAPR